MTSTNNTITINNIIQQRRIQKVIKQSVVEEEKEKEQVVLCGVTPLNDDAILILNTPVEIQCGPCYGLHEQVLCEEPKNHPVGLNIMKCQVMDTNINTKKYDITQTYRIVYDFYFVHVSASLYHPPSMLYWYLADANKNIVQQQQPIFYIGLSILSYDDATISNHLQPVKVDVDLDGLYSYDYTNMDSYSSLVLSLPIYGIIVADDGFIHEDHYFIIDQIESSPCCPCSDGNDKNVDLVYANQDSDRYGGREWVATTNKNKAVQIRKRCCPCGPPPS
jgi:hypothetical protein